MGLVKMEENFTASLIFHHKNMAKNKIYRFISSVRLAVILLAIIAALCVIATLIPQNLDRSHYTNLFGTVGGAVVTFLGFHTVFKSPLFFFFGIAFATNLFVCTWGRISTAIKISGKRFSIKTWGSPILHLGLCVILVGVAFSLIFKHEIYYEIPVGETVTVAGKNGGFTLTVDEFSVDYYDDNISPKQYRSSVTIGKPRQQPLPMEIQVNSPGKYNGVSILQQAYGWEITVTLSTGQSSTQLSIKDEDWIVMNESPAGNTTLGIAFYPDYDEEEGIVQMRSHQDNNPHIVWVLQEGDEPVAIDTLALGETGIIQEPLSITFDGYRYYSGLQMKYDPGIPVIFVGFLLLCLGLILLYLSGKSREQNHPFPFQHKNNYKS